MKLHKKLLVIFLVVNNSWAIYAQGKPDFFINKDNEGAVKGFRVGINYSISTLGLPPYADFVGIKPSVGFYVGGFYSTDIMPNQLAFRIDGSIQRKGAGLTDANGKLAIHARYYYAGITPLIGLHLANKLTLFIGPEVNVLVGKQDVFGKTYPLEVGSVVRLSYLFGRVGVEASYVRGFTKYDKLESSMLNPPIRVDFYNQNWQAGLIYKLTR